MTILDDIEQLLRIEAFLRPHAGFSNLKAKVNSALRDFDDQIGEVDILAKNIFPDDSGVVETHEEEPAQ